MINRSKKVLFYDSFEIKSDRWKEDTFSYYCNGKYHLYPRSFMNNFSWVSLHTTHNFRNFYYEADVEWLDGRKNAGFGLSFRAYDVENGYVFSITQNGFFSIGFLKQGCYKVLNDWESSDIINSKSNILGVACANNCITGYINNKPVLSLCDYTFERGYFGLFSNSNIHSRFNNVKIYEIDEDLLTLP